MDRSIRFFSVICCRYFYCLCFDRYYQRSYHRKDRGQGFEQNIQAIKSALTLVFLCEDIIFSLLYHSNCNCLTLCRQRSLKEPYIETNH